MLAESLHTMMASGTTMLPDFILANGTVWVMAPVVSFCHWQQCLIAYLFVGLSAAWMANPNLPRFPSRTPPAGA